VNNVILKYRYDERGAADPLINANPVPIVTSALTPRVPTAGKCDAGGLKSYGPNVRTCIDAPLGVAA